MDVKTPMRADMQVRYVSKLIAFFISATEIFYKSNKDRWKTPIIFYADSLQAEKLFTFYGVWDLKLK